MKSISSIQAKFLRNNSDGNYTRLWEDFDQKTQESVAAFIKLESEEECIIGFIDTNLYWWIITNKHLIVLDQANVQYFLLSSLCNVQIKKVFDIEIAKGNIEELLLKTKTSTILLKVEERTWYNVYDILKFITSG